MASELRVNTLKDASGNNSIATSFVAGGSVKSWLNLNGTGTIAARDSFNVSSLTDNGTGSYTIAFSDSMSNAFYSASGLIALANDAGSYNPLSVADRTTSNYRLDCENNSSGQSDPEAVDAQIHGDLA